MNRVKLMLKLVPKDQPNAEGIWVPRKIKTQIANNHMRIWGLNILHDHNVVAYRKQR